MTPTSEQQLTTVTINVAVPHMRPEDGLMVIKLSVLTLGLDQKISLKHFNCMSGRCCPRAEIG